MISNEEAKLHDAQLRVLGAEVRVERRIAAPSLWDRFLGKRDTKVINVRVVQIADDKWLVEKLVSRIGLFMPSMRTNRWEWSYDIGPCGDAVIAEFDSLEDATRRAALIALQHGFTPNGFDPYISSEY